MSRLALPAVVVVPALVVAVAAVAGIGVAWAVGRLRRRLVVVDVDGLSMAPAFRAGERVLVRRRPLRRIRTGDVVVAENPGRSAPDSRPGVAAADPAPAGRPWMLKRAAAVPGDPVPESVAPVVSAPLGTLVPDGRLVVLGDNADFSHDSRAFGYLSADRILGVVLRRI